MKNVKTSGTCNTGVQQWLHPCHDPGCSLEGLTQSKRASRSDDEMSSQSMFQPSGSSSLDGHRTPWRHCSPAFTGFPVVLVPAEPAPRGATTGSLWPENKTSLLAELMTHHHYRGQPCLHHMLKCFDLKIQSTKSLKSVIFRERTKGWKCCPAHMKQRTGE